MSVGDDARRDAPRHRRRTRRPRGRPHQPPRTAQLTLRRHALRLETAFASLSARKDVAAVVFTGTGDVFASGADIRELQRSRTSPRASSPRAASVFSKRIADARQLTIAAVNGYCMGGGLDLALACRVRVASPGAVFAHPGARLGIITGWGGTQATPAPHRHGPRARNVRHRPALSTPPKLSKSASSVASTPTRSPTPSRSPHASRSRLTKRREESRKASTLRLSIGTARLRPPSGRASQLRHVRLRNDFRPAFEEREAVGRDGAVELARASSPGSVERQSSVPPLTCALTSTGGSSTPSSYRHGGVELAVGVGQVNLHPAVVAALACGDAAEDAFGVESLRLRPALRGRSRGGQKAERTAQNYPRQCSHQLLAPRLIPNGFDMRRFSGLRCKPCRPSRAPSRLRPASSHQLQNLYARGPSAL